MKQVFFRRASTATAGIPLYFKGAVRSCVGKDRFKPLWVRLSFGIPTGATQRSCERCMGFAQICAKPMNLNKAVLP